MQFNLEVKQLYPYGSQSCQLCERKVLISLTHSYNKFPEPMGKPLKYPTLNCVRKGRDDKRIKSGITSLR